MKNAVNLSPTAVILSTLVLGSPRRVRRRRPRPAGRGDDQGHHRGARSARPGRRGRPGRAATLEKHDRGRGGGGSRGDGASARAPPPGSDGSRTASAMRSTRSPPSSMAACPRETEAGQSSRRRARRASPPRRGTSPSGLGTRSGRPLPWGAESELELEDFDSLSLDENHELGRAHARAGRWFAAHEAWETAWKQARDTDEAELFKGLSQMGAGYVHLFRGNAHGAATLLRRAAMRIARVPGREPGRPHAGARGTPRGRCRCGGARGTRAGRGERRWRPWSCSLSCA